MTEITHQHSSKPGRIVTQMSSPILHVIAMVSNPMRYNSRYRLYNDFANRMAAYSGINLVTVEVAYADRDFEVTTANNPNNIQLRTEYELWHKENAINVAISKLPADFNYLAWIDADIQFLNKDWVAETVHQLQHYSVVQLFQNAIDLGPTGQIIEQHSSLASVYRSGTPLQQLSNSIYGYGTFGHPGFCYAATKDAINAMGGLLDWAILGSGDHSMGLAFIGGAEYSIPGGVSQAYREELMEFQTRCEAGIKRNIGYVDGTISHFWHGRKADRKYQSRWDIITKNNFDPRKDIVRDWQGLYQLREDRPNYIKLRDDIRQYFLVRDEDGNSL